MNALKDQLGITGKQKTFTQTIQKPKHYNKVKDNTLLKENYNFMADLLFLPKTKQGFQYALVIVDLATDEFDIEPIADKDSSNIVKGEKGFYAKKYMLSIENLAWASSTLPGFTVNDLPYSERGPNGGRVMWFPPYDLKVSEQNSAKWEPNTFLGRPEPIYTYQNSERNGTIGFKVIVDHPSILNLLVREHFKSVNETDTDAYINAFFAGAKDIDFYSLIRQYTHLDSDDIKMIQSYLNDNGKWGLMDDNRWDNFIKWLIFF
jgi:hypothetical protein